MSAVVEEDVIVDADGGGEEEAPDAPVVPEEPKDLDAALAAKAEGNAAYKRREFEEALRLYERAISLCPVEEEEVLEGEEESADSTSVDADGDAEPAAASEATESEEPAEVSALDATTTTEGAEEAAAEPKPPTELQVTLAIFHGNAAAVLLALMRYEEARTHCDAALKLNPAYTKLYLRRATVLEQLGKYCDALADVEKAAAGGMDARVVDPMRRRLKPLAAEEQEKLKAEALGTLKKLGDALLSPFGMSTDNFKFNPDGKGGYSMSFER
eukprot:PLAT8884.1.p1 GENE.PLAT8884.1~~PLAT8884.1.p1  ORF type:complete len:271 (+),score=110.85 PLAT8884.1:54-866(+)